ncbi:L protein [Wenling fish chu-like virus]|uniref:RNA-directed RNA polymerase n=2 Tax=Riboviria TaxID=2559587 RepID=A0A2P1GMQ1_9VIRU|nr:L protein [Wenling fish chu-like virus]AVM87275.1 L protein [Wenling fish chu-like virus]AVM87278.1 L protein [Wenling fish chuvirus-like virus]
MFSDSFFKRVLESPEAIVNDRKLSVALRDSTTYQILEDIKQGLSNLNTRCLLFHNTPEVILSARRDSNLWPEILSDILLTRVNKVEYTTPKNDTYDRVRRLVKENMEFQHTYMTSNSIINSAPDLQEWLVRVCSSDTLMRNLVQLEEEVSDLVERIGTFPSMLRDHEFRECTAKLRRASKGHVNSIQLRASWSKNAVMFRFNGSDWILPIQYILLIHNKLCDLLSSLLLIQNTAGVAYEHDARERVLDFVSELTHLALTEIGFFDIAKSLEGLIISEILRREETWINTELYDSIVQEFGALDYEYDGSRLQEILMACSTPLLHELGGLSKITGHPLIDTARTAGTAETRACKPVTVDYYAIQMSRNIAVETFIRNYYARNGKWPPVEIDAEAPVALQEAYRLQKEPGSSMIKRRHGVIRTEDYVYVSLGKVLEFNQLEHYLQYLKDKTITVLRQPVIRTYVERVSRESPWKDTRLLLVHLTHTEAELNRLQYLHQYMDSDMTMDDVLDYLIIKLVPKEKELKVVARPFGCKTYLDRYRSCLQEENTKHYLDLYGMDQSMTLDNLGLIKRMYTFRNLTASYKGWKVLYINFDVSGWCANFRHETVEPIATDVLDAVHGTKNFFSKTQRAYERGYFYLPDSKGTYHWEGMDGGVEGLNQYTWMAVYIPQMRYLLRDFNLHFHVMAYGDDYKAAMLIPPDQDFVDVRKLKSDIVRIVSDSAKVSFGQQMKYFDSYGSEAYISFCKNASVRGIELPQGIRKVQKCYGSTNAFLPTLDDYISSAYSNAHSTARVMTCTFGSYSVALFWTYLHLLVHKCTKGLRDVEILAMSLIPSCVGGLPIIYLDAFHTRAENDHLPTFLHMIEFARVYHPELASIMSRALSYDKLGPESFETLLRDPYSLPIRKPPLPSGLFRSEVLPALRPLIRNEEVLQLLEASEDDWTDAIVVALTSSSILYPRIFSSIYACTPKALVEELVKRFETSASIKDILVLRRGRKAATRILRKVIRAELTLQTWRVDRIRVSMGESHYIPSGCPTRDANTLRRGWGKEVAGVTMPPMVHLVAVQTPEGAVGNPHAVHNHFTYILHDRSPVMRSGETDHWSLGDKKPFLGWATKLGSELPMLRILEDNPFLAKIKTLLDAISWVDKGGLDPTGNVVHSNLPQLIRILLTQYYRGDVDDLMPFGAKRKSGTIQHHWRSPHYREHIMPNSLYNGYTWVSGESNTHSTLRGSVDHFTINFLQIYCHVIHMLQIRMEVTPFADLSGQYWGVTSPCQFCMAPIVEPPIILNEGCFPAPRTTVLDEMEITSFSRQVLQSASSEMSAKGIRKTPDTGPPISMAVAGVVQQLMDQTMVRTARVDENLGLRAQGTNLDTWVPGTSSVPVGEREIRRSPVRPFVESLLLQIYQRALTFGKRRQLRDMLYQVWITDPGALPWTSTLERIRHAGRLAECVIEVEKLSGLQAPICHYSSTRAARYLGECAVILCGQGRIPIRLVWLSYYEDTMIEQYLERYVRQVKYTIIWKRLRPYLMSCIAMKENDLAYETVRAMIIIATMTHVDSDQIRHHFSTTDIGHVAISCLDGGFCDEETYEDCLADKDSVYYEVEELLSLVSGFSNMLPLDYVTLTDRVDEPEKLYNPELTIYSEIYLYEGSLADCIAVVRDCKDAPVAPLPIAARDTGWDLVGPDAGNSQGFLTGGVDQPATSVVVLPDIDLSQDSYLIPTVYGIWAPFFRGSVSMPLLLEVFAFLDIDVKTIDGLNCLILGDHDGGVTDVIASIGTACYLHVNAVPEDLRDAATPVLAMPRVAKGRHIVNSDLANMSIHDLTQESTRRGIRDYDNRHYHLTICTDTRARPAENLVDLAVLYLEKRTIAGTFMCLFHGSEYRGACMALSVLGQHCVRVGVVHLSAAPMSHMYCLVAYGTRRSYTGHTLSLTNNLTRLLITLIQRKHELCIQMKPPKDTLVKMSLPVISPYLSQFYDILPPGFSYMISAEHSIPVRIREADQTSACTLADGYLRELRIAERKSVTQMQKSPTLAALIRQIYLTSVIHYSTAFLKHHIVRVSQSEMRQDYVDCVDKLGMYDLPDDDTIFEEFTVEQGTVHLWMHWIQGCDTSLMFWAWERIKLGG